MLRLRRPHASMPSAEPPVPSSLPSGPSSLWWGRDVFLSEEGEGDCCPVIVDVTGRSRHLIYGPYLPLAAGRWRATAFLDLCADAAKRMLAVELGVYPHFTAVDLRRGVAGRHVVTIEHMMVGEGLAELRLWLKKPAFHGQVRFHGAVLARVGEE